MDYFGYAMNLIIIFVLVFVTNSESQYSRDIILTPHKVKTHPGKVIYFKPRNVSNDENSLPTNVPWEDVLKETVYLALNDKENHNRTKIDQPTSNPKFVKKQQKAIHNAPYIGVVDSNKPRFGDIVELARGKLEKENEETYYFIQNDKRDNSETLHNVTALWTVERIRHRDDNRGHRYELKFTISPLESYYTDDNNNKIVINKSFIVRDEDYPKYFTADSNRAAASARSMNMMRKNDQPFIDRTFYGFGNYMNPQPMAQYPHATNRYMSYRAPMSFGELLMQTLMPTPQRYTPPQHYYGHDYGMATKTYNRIRFPDSKETFTAASYQNNGAYPKYYHHVHQMKPQPNSVTQAPVHNYEASSSSQIKNVDHSKLVDLRGAVDHVEAKPNNENNLAVKPQYVEQQPHQHHHYQHQQLSPTYHHDPHLLHSIPIYNPNNFNQGQLVLNHIPVASSNQLVHMPQPQFGIPLQVQILPPNGQFQYTPQPELMQHVRYMHPLPTQMQVQTHILPPMNHIAQQPHPSKQTTQPAAQPLTQSSNLNTFKFTSANAVLPQKYTQPLINTATSPKYHPTTFSTVAITPPTPHLRSSYNKFSDPDPLYTSTASSTTSTTTSKTTTRQPSIYSSSHIPPFKGIPSGISPQIENPISTTLKTYNYLGHPETYDFIPSKMVELAHHNMKKFNPKYQQSKPKRKSANKTKHFGSETIENFSPQSHNKFMTKNKHFSGETIENTVSSTPAPNFNSYNNRHKYYSAENFDVTTMRPYNNHHKYYSAENIENLAPTQSYNKNKWRNSGEHEGSTHKPESINAQLPPPDKETDGGFAPFVPSARIQSTFFGTTTPYAPTVTTETTTQEPPQTTTRAYLSKYFKNRNEKSDEIITTIRPRLSLKAKPTTTTTTTEKPVLKWVPKRARNSSISRSSIELLTTVASLESLSSSSTSSEANVEIVTHSPSTKLEHQMHRLKSRGRNRYFHKKISSTFSSTTAPKIPARVPKSSTEATTTTTIPTTTTTQPPTSTDSSALEFQTQPNFITSISFQVGKDDDSKILDTANMLINKKENEIRAEPLTDENFEMVKANITPIQTNSSTMMLFQASDTNPLSLTDSTKDFDNLTMSIINHAKALDLGKKAESNELEQEQKNDSSV